jgi:mannose-1-phosphate guanylyltransferase
MQTIFPVILAGGKGERFWPYSTSSHPKQLLPLVTRQSMLEDALDHVRNLLPDGEVLIVASSNLVDPMRKKLEKWPLVRVVGEPVGKNTAAAIALALQLIRKKNPKGVMLVLTADHFIRPPEAFRKALATACQTASTTDALITFGIKPDRPETGFGYIRTEQDVQRVNDLSLRKVSAFVEKPDAPTAKKYLEEGCYFWNSGMFIWRVDYCWQQMRLHLPEVTEPISSIKDEGELDHELHRVYPTLPSISIDYGLMEKCSDILCMESSFDWDDVGSWQALERIHPADEAKNTCLGEVVTLESSGNIIVQTGEGLIATFGVKDLLIAHVEGVTVVCSREQIPHLKTLVAEVKAKKGDKYL